MNEELKDELEKLRVELGKGENTTQEQLDAICLAWQDRIEPSDKEKEEILVLVNPEGNATTPQRRAPRWLCHLLGLRHRCALVLLRWQSRNLGNVFVFQVRSWDKFDSPGHLDISVGGHVIGETTSEVAAFQEMQEEFGVDEAGLKDGKLVFVGGYESYDKRAEDSFFNAEWRDVYMGELTDLNVIKFEDKEVVGLYLCPESEARNLLTQGFIPIASALEYSLPKCLQYLDAGD